MVEDKPHGLQFGEMQDRLAADWYKERAGAKPEEIVGSLLAAGASLKDYSLFDPGKIRKKDRDLYWKPEEIGGSGSRRIFRLQGNAQASRYSVLKFKYGLEKALVTSSFDGKRGINLYYIPYLRTTRFPFPPEPPRIEEKESSVFVLREDQVKKICHAISIKIPVLSDKGT